jgi:hypothetical protein
VINRLVYPNSPISIIYFISVKSVDLDIFSLEFTLFKLFDIREFSLIATFLPMNYHANSFGFLIQDGGFSQLFKKEENLYQIKQISIKEIAFEDRY